MNRTISGDTINELMVAKTNEISAYNIALKAYNYARSMWNGSLRIVDGLVDWSMVSLFIPAD